MTICNIKAYQVVFDKYKNSKKLTTNNAESINNIMKLDANWKSHSTPALINLLADMIKLQQLDLQHALYNSGNYRLFGFNKKNLHPGRHLSCQDIRGPK